MSRIPEKAQTDPILRDIQVMRAAFYALNSDLARKSGIGAAELMMLLKEISEDVYTAGVDKVFATAPLEDKDNIADAFDFTWLAALAIRLNNYTPKMANGEIPKGHKLIRRGSWRRKKKRAKP